MRTKTWIDVPGLEKREGNEGIKVLANYEPDTGQLGTTWPRPGIQFNSSRSLGNPSS